MAVLTAKKHSVVTPSDVTTFSSPQAIYVGTGGDVALRLIGNSDVATYKNVPSGSWLPVEADKVMSTNTTATDILMLGN